MTTSHPIRTLNVEYCCPKCQSDNISEVFKAWCTSDLQDIYVQFENGSITAEPVYTGSSDTDYESCGESSFICALCDYQHNDIMSFVPADVKLMAPFPNSPLHVVSAPDTQPHQETPAA